MRYLLQAFLALGALIAAPLLFDAPDELWQQIAAGAVALILAGLALRGMIGFVRSRKPHSYPDSLMPPKVRLKAPKTRLKVPKARPKK
jgi:hypothetical protein